MPSTDLCVHSLASGSSANSMLVQLGADALLIDAGVPARTLVEALGRRHVGKGNLLGVLLTHEHDDHMRAAQAISRRLETPVIANRATLQAADARTELTHTVELPTGSEDQIGPFVIRSFPVSHDAAEPAGYVIRVAGCTIFYATDTGCASPAIAEAMIAADLCVIESNHDLDWLRLGPYPPAMKARIASDHGHLSNSASVHLMAERLEQGGPTVFWLAHLSRANNSPALARRYALEQIPRLTRTPFVLDVALRDRPSLVWQPGRTAAQLDLFG